jgi:hypothetical protein
MRMPALLSVFLLLVWPFVIVMWTYFLSDSFELTFNVALSLLLFYHTYFGIQNMFLNPQKVSSTFEIESPNDITWENILKAISGFSNNYCGLPIGNKLKKQDLSRCFPYIAKRFMFRNAAKVITDNMGRYQSFATEHPDACKAAGAGLAGLAATGATVVTFKLESRKVEATEKLAKATEYAADKQAKATEYAADKQLESTKITAKATEYKANKYFEAHQIRIEPIKNEKFQTSKINSSAEVKAPSLFVDQPDWVWYDFFYKFFSIF